MSKPRKNPRKIPLFVLLILLLAGVFSLAEGKAGTRSITEAIPAEAGYYELARVSLEQHINLTPPVNLQELQDLSTLRSRYYSVDKKTLMTYDLFNINRLMERNIHIDPLGTEPKVLIFHTHAHEMYADSKAGQGVVGAGELLKTTLEQEYGIGCIHVTESFDTVDGSLQILGAYERMEAPIREILAANPSIEMVIDLHRDGVGENVRLVSRVEGEDCAKLMFFNGLCQRATGQGTVEPTEGLTNPYLEDNLALSLRLQMKANELYPGLARKIYLNAYRYSLHLKPLSMLVELGAQTNTEAEVAATVPKLAKVIYEGVFEG